MVEIIKDRTRRALLMSIPFCQIQGDCALSYPYISPKEVVVQNIHMEALYISYIFQARSSKMLATRVISIPQGHISRHADWPTPGNTTYRYPRPPLVWLAPTKIDRSPQHQGRRSCEIDRGCASRCPSHHEPRWSDPDQGRRRCRKCGSLRAPRAYARSLVLSRAAPRSWCTR